jgi:hypothetical protein
MSFREKDTPGQGQGVGAMGEKLDRIFEYRVLLSKQRDLGMRLSDQEQARLERLGHQLPAQVPAADDRDPYTLLTQPLPVEFVVNRKSGHGMLRNASGGGFAIATDQPPELGAHVVAHVREEAHGIEYIFPGIVVARVVKGVTAFGFGFQGLPTQTRLGGRSSGVWRSDPTPAEHPVARRPRGT